MFKNHFIAVVRWLDSYQGRHALDTPVPSLSLQKSDWVRCVPYILLHIACIGIFWVGWSWTAVLLAIGAYLIRMFAITAFYHRYFSHRSFKTTRFWQFLFALIGSWSVQRGPLWWAAHHRYHHKHADTEKDVHSPLQSGFLWSHTAWFMSDHNFRTKTALVKDWIKFPELVFLDRFDIFGPVVFALLTIFTGYMLYVFAPQLETSGLQLFFWVFCLSTVALYHCTFTINSLSHKWGTRRFDVNDSSRNNLFLAFLTLGEGWHNNHHYYPTAARQGFFWWEFDFSYYCLCVLKRLGIVWDLNPVPQRVYQKIKDQPKNKIKSTP